MNPSPNAARQGARALRLLQPLFVVERSDPARTAPPLPGGSLWSVTRTGREVSVIREADPGREDEAAGASWRCLEVQGPIPHDAVGVLATLTAVLRDAGIPILALSTYDTDYLFVPATRAQDAVGSLRAAGYSVTRSARASIGEEIAK